MSDTCGICGGFQPLTFKLGPQSHPSFAVLVTGHNAKTALVHSVHRELEDAEASARGLVAIRDGREPLNIRIGWVHSMVVDMHLPMEME